MEQTAFYKHAINGCPMLIDRLLDQVNASHTQMCMILGDTARIADLGGPETNPNEDELTSWRFQTPPLWVSKTALFLVLQMPQKPVPDEEDEQAAWAYLWLRLRSFESLAAAQLALPLHLKESLAPYLTYAWQDLINQRLL